LLIINVSSVVSPVAIRTGESIDGSAATLGLTLGDIDADTLALRLGERLGLNDGDIDTEELGLMLGDVLGDNDEESPSLGLVEGDSDTDAEGEIEGETETDDEGEIETDLD